MKRLIAFIYSFVFFLSAELGAQTPCQSLRYQDTIFHSVTETTDIYFATAIPYGIDAQPEDLYLDFYEPANDTAPLRPLIVYQFGGGFVIGWREEPDIPQFCTYFAQLGYAVATIDYRLGLDPLDTGSTVRAYYRAVQDERSAIRYLCQNAQQYRLDTSRIILTGTSAGCFCSFANAFTNDSDRPACTYGTVLEPTDLGCMDCSGNYDFDMHIPHVKAIVDMWGAILDTNYITSLKNTPTILIQGTDDDLVPYYSGYPFDLPVFPIVYGAVPINQRMNNVGLTNELVPLVGYGHEPELLAPQLNDTIYSYSQRFLFPLLQPSTSSITGDSIVCFQSAAHYSVVNTPGSFYCWQLNGNGTIVQNTNNAIVVLWSDTGEVSVSVSELNNIDASGAVEEFNTYVSSVPQASFTCNTNQLQVDILNHSTDAATYFWNFGNGDTSDFFLNPVLSYSSGGTYRITLIAANNYCADTFVSTITIDSCPQAHFTFQQSGANAFFYADTTNTTDYNWNFGDGDTVSVPSPAVFHQYSGDGTFPVVLQVANNLGCTSQDTAYITIKATDVGLISDNLIQATCDLSNGCKLVLPSNGLSTIEVMDISGRTIIKTEASNSYFLNTESLSAGVYLLKIECNNQIFVRKFVKGM